ncbi:PAB1 binding protein, partial [Coemansia sp. RSA 2052]
GYAVRNNRPQMPQPAMPMGGGAAGSMPMGGAGNVSGGAPAGSAGQTIQQIYVPGDKIGAVIGRRGETINEIRRATSARVDIQDSGPGAKQRLIIITGGYDQVRSAYYMIKNKVDMARPAAHP